jgi:hypothetical protein
MKKSTIFSYLGTIFLCVCVCFVLFGTFSLNAAPEEPGSEKAPKGPPVAEMMIGPNMINWAPVVEYSQLVLTVGAPGGKQVQQTFNYGEPVYFEPSAAFNGQLPDGVYRYELQVAPILPKGFKPVRGEKKAIQDVVQGKTQSGAFSILKGSIITAKAPEELSQTKDYLFEDDVIIDGSLCVGYDCENAMGFGYDTLVLKEAVLRLMFLDTSATSGSYPSND